MYSTTRFWLSNITNKTRVVVLAPKVADVYLIFYSFTMKSSNNIGRSGISINTTS